MVDSKAAIVLAKELHELGFAHNVKAKTWHKFDGFCWHPLETSQEPDKAILEALITGTEPLGFRPAYFNGTTNIMLWRDSLPLPPEQPDKIPFQNGLLDIHTKQLEPLTKANAQTWVISHQYHESKKCPLFTTLVNNITGNDRELNRFIFAVINACIVGRADLQIFIHLLGPGSTGKSTFIRLLVAILGEHNCATTDLIRLETNRFETSLLYGKRLAAITDSDKYGGSVNMLKALTGQDHVPNERKGIQQTASFIYTGMVIIASNEPLQSTDYTSGIARRGRTIKFTRRITAQEKAEFMAKGGEAALHAEIPAIINLALSLSRDEVTNLFNNPPDKVKQAAHDALAAQNPVVDWICENLIPDADSWLPMGFYTQSNERGEVNFENADSHLYPNYLRRCYQQQRKHLNLPRFKHVVADMLLTLKLPNFSDARTGKGNGIKGVRFRLMANNDAKEYEPVYDWLKMNAG